MMTAKERADQVLDMKAARQMGDMFVSLLVEGFIKGYQLGQEDMGMRAAEVVENTPRLMAGILAEKIRSLPIE